VVVKQAPRADAAECEAFMLGYLRAHSPLPVPQVLGCEADLLVLEQLPSGGPMSRRAQAHAAQLLAGLHACRGPYYGFERDTLIGPLTQPNPPSVSWLEFFRDHRLVDRARQAYAKARLPPETFARIERLAGRLERWIEEPAYPALVHGDAWDGNILVHQERVSGFIDPAIYWADPEIELAFGTLFGTFGAAFFERYQEHRSIPAEFFEARREIYLLYPLLVHAELFGGSYAADVDRITGRLLA
jgi:fructosamine-3-kinase